jgi:hypothetical protein
MIAYISQVDMDLLLILLRIKSFKALQNKFMKREELWQVFAMELQLF